MSLEKVGTHHTPSDVLTNFVQASALGQHFAKLNLFKDHSLSQVFKFCSGVKKLKVVHGSPTAEKEAHCSDQRLARLYHQVCQQRQGQVCMINLEGIQNHQDFMIQRFKSAIKIRKAFTPPPRRRIDESSHSARQTIFSGGDLSPRGGAMHMLGKSGDSCMQGNLHITLLLIAPCDTVDIRKTRKESNLNPSHQRLAESGSCCKTGEVVHPASGISQHKALGYEAGQASCSPIQPDDSAL